MSPATPLKVHWIRSNGFLLGLVLAVIVAFLFPGPGSRGGPLHAEAVNNFGIALILFLQGLSLAFERIRSGAGNWRLHVVIQSFTFVVFPLAGLLLDALIPRPPSFSPPWREETHRARFLTPRSPTSSA